MKNCLILVTLLCVTNFCFSQIKFIKSLILLTNSEASAYLDSLTGLKKDRYYSVRKDTTQNGDQTLSVSFHPSDEKFYTCTSILLGFTESNGINFCTFQLLMGTVKYSASNLSYIKKNFKYISQGHWTKHYKKDIPIIIDVTFDREADKNGVYSIIYQAKSVSKN